MLPKLEEIQRRRKLLDITQKKLAVLSGVSQSTVAKIESKKKKIKPSYESVKSIFKALDKAEERNPSKRKAKDIHNTSKIIGIKKSDTIIKASQIMIKHEYSQLPVYEGDIIVGSISEDDINKYISRGESLSSIPNIQVKDIMSAEFPKIEERTSIVYVAHLLQCSPAVLTTRKGRVVGIITKTDLFKLIIR